ncbi:MAG: ImmA/IrrE family metallo-endopeptidase [Xanthobacteraceae bacterium]
MIEDFIVKPRSGKEIEQVALAWRDALGVQNEWAPNMVDLLENRIPRFFPEFALAVRTDSEMTGAEAFTEFSPPRIVLSESVYLLAAKKHGRSRMTCAHELGHLVMHADTKAKPRMAVGNRGANSDIFRSAEWQARKFAAMFLLPTHVVREFSNSDQLSECCQVSKQAAQIRFEESGIKKQLPECVSLLGNQLKQP